MYRRCTACDLSTTMGPVIQRSLSRSSGQAVGSLSEGAGSAGLIAVAEVQVEPDQSAGPFKPPSLVLLTRMIAAQHDPIVKGSVSLLKFMKTSCLPTSGAPGVSSVATH